MWRLLTAATYTGERFSANYDGTYMSPISVAPLDPIDVAGTTNVRGVLRMTRLLHWNTLFPIMEILDEESTTGHHVWLQQLIGDLTRENLLRSGAPEKQTVQPIYRQHMTQLMGYDILRTTIDPAIFFSSYFAVPKTEDTARAIFNGRRLSERCPVPPPVNLATPTTILPLLEDFLHQHSSIFIMGADMRHWFHQLRLPRSLWPLFALNSDNRTLAWTTLPMGWSWSPCVAQAFAWALLAGRQANEEPLFEEAGLKEGSDLPTFLRTKRGGFVFVYYDNFVIITPQKEELDVFKKRFERTCAEYSAVVKQGSEFLADTGSFIAKGVEFLGMKLQGIARIRDRRGRLRCDGFTCRPAKIDEWAAMEVAGSTTPRDFAGFVGRSVFAETLACIPLGTTPRGKLLLKCARQIGSLAFSGGWDKQLDDETCSRVRDMVAELWKNTLSLKDSPHAFPRPMATRDVNLVIATDASDTGYGYMIYELSPEGLRLLHPEETYVFQWNEEMRTKHIFEKELTAAVRGLETIRSTYARTDSRCLLVVDNSAACFVLRNGFSNHKGAMLLLERYSHCLSDVEVLLVISGDNPADCPSRGDFRDHLVRGERLLKCIRAWRNGWSWSSGPRRSWERSEADGPIRHAEPIEAELFLEGWMDNGAEPSTTPSPTTPG
jgi:hypothetical protein